MSFASPEVAKFLSKLQGVKKSGANYAARCPCRNDDNNPSLSIGQGNDGRVLVTCHRGNPCSMDQICEAMGISKTELFPPKDVKDTQPRKVKVDAPKSGKLSLVATYDYYDAKGTLLFQKQRFIDENGKKTFRQRKPDGEGGWTYQLGEVPRVLYRLPQILNAVAHENVVWIVEGEKDADTLVEQGFEATTMPNGAGTWLDIHTEALAGAKVAIIADNDQVGLEHALAVATQLTEAKCDVVLLKPPSPFKDVTEMYEQDKDVLFLVELNENGEESQEPESDEPDLMGELLSGLQMLLKRDDLSEDQRISRASIMLNSFSRGADVDRGRLVDWEEFLSEDYDDSYEWVIPGVLEKQERVIVVAAEGVGKRATIDSVIPTPSGWTTLGDISVGDKVIDRFGNPVNVTYVSPIEPNPDAYRVTFSDGNFIDADAEHQWYTETLNEREKRKVGGVRTTAEIRDTLISNRQTKALNHAIPTTKPLNLPEAKLPIPPYTLGAWLGDGTTIDGSICCEDDEILEAIRNDGYVVRKRESTTNMYGILGLQTQLKEHGLYGNKHIPVAYSRASYEQRLALVQGLMDTDGYVRKDGLCEFSVNCQELAKGFLDLIQTLGIKATMRTGDAKLYGRTTGIRYRISFKTDIMVCRLKRKANPLPKELKTPRSLYRYIVSIEPIPPVPMRCISVDGPDNTYLIGDAYIPTHNTMLARQVALCCAGGLNPFNLSKMPPIRTLTVDLENPERIIRRTSSNIMGAVKRFGHTDKVQAEILIKPSGLDLLKNADRAVLEQAIEKSRPQLLVMGPLYKSFIDPGGRTSESIAIEVAKYLDGIRDVYGCALWLEHHAPLGSSMGSRDLRPFGSAVWSRWPEFGLSLTPDPTATDGYVYNVSHFRGARDKRAFPTRMRRGKTFPFEVIEFMKVD